MSCEFEGTDSNRISIYETLRHEVCEHSQVPRHRETHIIFIRLIQSLQNQLWSLMLYTFVVCQMFRERNLCSAESKCSLLWIATYPMYITNKHKLQCQENSGTKNWRAVSAREKSGLDDQPDSTLDSPLPGPRVWILWWLHEVRGLLCDHY